MSEIQEPVKVGARMVLSQDGLSVVVIAGETELLMAVDDAAKFGRRIVEEADRAKGVNMMAAAMTDAKMTAQTIYRALYFAVYGKRVQIPRRVINALSATQDDAE